MAASSGGVEVSIKFHDPFPREAYVELCVREGREVTADGYERWRDTCERLSGDMSTERRIAKLGAHLAGAFAELGVSAGEASAALDQLGIALQPTVALAKKADR